MLPVFWLAFASLACSSVFGSAIPIETTDSFIGIYGGHNVTITDYPYQVAIYEEGVLHCGGSILNERFILTATHCFYESFGNVTIRAGSTYSDHDGQVIYVKTINLYPNFTLETIDNDIAVLELETPLTFSDSVQPVQLPTANATFKDNDTSVATGWGVASQQGDYEVSLKMVTLPLTTTTTCRKIYGDFLTDNMFCAGGVVGEGTCYGDGGGPVVANGVQIGITSFGSGCAVVRPAVYTKVSQYLSFIASIIDN